MFSNDIKMKTRQRGHGGFKVHLYLEGTAKRREATMVHIKNGLLEKKLSTLLLLFLKKQII